MSVSFPAFLWSCGRLELQSDDQLLSFGCSRIKLAYCLFQASKSTNAKRGSGIAGKTPQNYDMYYGANNCSGVAGTQSTVEPDKATIDGQKITSY